MVRVLDLLYSPSLKSRAIVTLTLASVVANGTLAGCGDDDGFDYQGEAGTLVPAAFPGWVPQVNGGATTADRLLVIDTGAPVTILDRDSFALTPDGQHTLDLHGFGLTFPAYPAISYDIFGAPPGTPGSPDGIFGGDLLRHFALWLDYRGGQAALFAGSPPDGDAAIVEPAITLPVEILGGGRSLLPGNCGEQPCGVIELPATRVLLSARFEGQAEWQWVLVDTGASAVATSESFLASLGHADERPRLDGITITTASGLALVAMSRLATLELGTGTPARADEPSVSLASLPILVLPTDELLQNISDEVGHPIVALVGGSFLREFQTTVDYPDRALVLERYRARDHIPADEYIGVGFTLAPAAGGTWAVADVYSGTDADMKGVKRNMTVESIDGKSITGLPSSSVDAFFDGKPVGSTITIEVIEVGAPVTKSVLIEDLLPSYP